jgi:hypothetical protein
MNVEKVKLLVTLQTETSTYLEGEIYESPLPKDLLQEVYAGRGTVEVLKYASAVTSHIPSGSVIPRTKKKLVLRKR